MTFGLDDSSVDVTFSPLSECSLLVQSDCVQDVNFRLVCIPSMAALRHSCFPGLDGPTQSGPWVRLWTVRQALLLHLKRSGMLRTSARTCPPWPPCNPCNPTLQSCDVKSCAPKIRIGGSGAYASSQAGQGLQVVILRNRSFAEARHSFDIGRLLLCACRMAEGLFRSMWAWMCLIVCRLLCHRMVRGASHPGGSFGRPVGGCSPVLVKALGFASPKQVVLDWSPAKKRFPASRRCRPGRVSWLVWLLGFASVPTCVWAAPVGLKPFLTETAFICQSFPEALDRSARIGRTDDFRSTASDAGYAQGSFVPDRPAGSAEVGTEGRDHSGIGITVYAPFFQALALRLQCHGSASAVGLLSFAARELRVRNFDFDRVVLARPQMVEGHVSLVVVAPLLQEQAKTVVVVDLTQLGGSRFAAAIPSTGSVKDFVEVVVQPLFGSCEDRCVFVGPQQRLVTASDALDVDHGDVIAVLPRGQAPAPAVCIDHLLRAGIVECGQQANAACRLRSEVAVWCRERFEVFPSQAFDEGQAFALLADKAGVAEGTSQMVFVGGLVGLSVDGVACDLAAIPWQMPEGSADGCGPRVLLVLDARAIGAGVKVAANVGEYVTLGQLVALAHLPDSLSQVLCWREEARAEYTSSVCSLVRLYPRARPFELSPHEQTGSLVLLGGGDVSGDARAGEAQGDLAEAGGNASDHDEDNHSASSSVASSSDDATDGSEGACVASAFVLSPDRISQGLHMRIVPFCSGQDLIDAVAHTLDAEFYRLFSLLVPCRQQLSDRWGLILALPAWASDEPLVVIDSRECDGRLFLAPVAREVSRQHVLAVADIDDESVDVYPFGRHVALVGDQSIQLQPFGVIRLVRVRSILGPSSPGLEWYALSTMVLAGGVCLNIPLRSRRVGSWRC